MPFKGKFQGTMGEDLHAALRRSDLATEVLGDIFVEATKDLDSRLGRGWHPCATTGIGPLGKGIDLSQVQKTTKNTCPRSLLLSGKLSTTNTLVVSNLNYDYLFLSGSLGDVAISSMGFSTGPPLSCSVAVFCKVPTVGEFYPPPLITLIVTTVGIKESGFSCDLKVSSPLINDEVEGTSGFYFVGLTTDVEPAPSLSTSPMDLTGTFPHLCSQSTSGNSSSDGSRVHYSLRNRSILTEDFCVGGDEELVGRGLGSLPRLHYLARGRGRKSHLLLAQDHARIDLASGRQSSIEWALREKQSHGVVSL
jgi:hypothetical protein